MFDILEERVKINKDHFLEIFRKNEYQVQFCPFSVEENACGDWCPLFREPREFNGYIILSLCKTEIRLHMDSFLDERDSTTKRLIKINKDKGDDM